MRVTLKDAIISPNEERKFQRMEGKKRDHRSSLKKFSNIISNPSDLTGEASPSVLYPFMTQVAYRLLTDKPQKVITKKSIRLRKTFPIIKLVSPGFMKFRQVIESKRPVLSEEPVIWCANHSFKDDVAATIRAARFGYVFFGSMPIFCNTTDGFGVWLNGTVLCNRKLRESRRRAYQVALKVLDMGTDLLIFPEGVWNATPEKVILHLWPGAVRLAKEKGIKIIPVVHYLRDPHMKYRGNVIHTVIGEPIGVKDLSEKEGITLLRDAMATMYYDLMDQYGQTTREELLAGFDSADSAWENYMKKHFSLPYFDLEIESTADYRVSTEVRATEVWRSISEVTDLHMGNIDHVLYARQLMKQETRRDYQRRICSLYSPSKGR